MTVRNHLMMATGKGGNATGSVAAIERSSAVALNGFISLCLTGSTAQRPALGDNDFPGGVPAAIPYFDSTLGYVVFSDGTGRWRNPANGNAV